LNSLLSLCNDSEQGFLVTTSSVDNRAVKALLHSYADQRVRFAEELAEEIRRLGGEPRSRHSWLGHVHRGWIGLKTGMLTEPQRAESAAIAEALRGERVALERYRRALKSELGPAAQTVERQAQEIKQVVETLNMMNGVEGRRLVIRLFDRTEDVEQAKEALRRLGFDHEQIELIAATEMLRETPRTHGPYLPGDTALTAALFGVGLGILIALITAANALFSAPGEPFTINQLLTYILVGGGAGAAIGGLLGFLIGWGDMEKDRYIHEESLQHGDTLLLLRSDDQRAAEAANIMQQINARSRALAR
jgi:uncharacterized protein (TIGR02284 family)